MPSYGYLCFAPPERGGRADLKERILRIAQESGRSAPEVADEVSDVAVFLRLLVLNDVAALAGSYVQRRCLSDSWIPKDAPLGV